MAKPYYFANWIPKLQAEGHSAASAMDVLRSQGHTFSDTMFRRVWAETQDHLAKSEALTGIPLNRVPPPEVIGTATRPKARGYLYQTEMAVHDPTTGEVSFHVWGVRSQRRISLGNALRMAVDSWNASQESGRGSPPGIILGGMVTSVLNLVGPEDTIDE